MKTDREKADNIAMRFVDKIICPSASDAILAALAQVRQETVRECGESLRCVCTDKDGRIDYHAALDAILRVGEQQEPVGPFGERCKCWTNQCYAENIKDNWQHRTNRGKPYGVYIHGLSPDYTHCPFCGEKRVTK